MIPPRACYAKPDPSRAYLAWLVDPKDLAGGLAAAVKRFQQKAEWGGKRPTVVRCKPDLVERLEPIALAMGLTVVVDRIASGLLYLGREGDDDRES